MKVTCVLPATNGVLSRMIQNGCPCMKFVGLRLDMKNVIFFFLCDHAAR